MRLRFVLVTLIAMLWSVRAMGQERVPDRGRPWFAEASHWGRWLSLAGAAGMIGIAASEHVTANDALDDLETFCTASPESCAIVSSLTRSEASPAEHYADPDAEALYQEYAAHERRARGYLLGGQMTLVVAGGMFLIDLLYRDEQPENIPFTPLEIYSTRNKLGLSLRF